MSSSANRASEFELKFLLPKIDNPPNKSIVDLKHPGLTLIIWDVLLGIPFSLLIALANQACIQWLGYERIIRCSSGILISRAVMIAVNLWVVWSWRKQLIRGERERRVRAEIEMLDEVIACLERVLAGVEAREIEEQLLNDMVMMEEVGEVVPYKAW